MRKNLFRAMRPDEFLEAIEKVAPSRPFADNFRSFCEAAYCALARRATADRQRAQQLEQRYESVMDAYGGHRLESHERLSDLLGRLARTLYLTEDDFLGQAYMASGIADPQRGVAFSPTGVGQLLSRLIFPHAERQDIAAVVAKGEPFPVSDPTCGSGILVIQVADLLKYQGFDLGRTLLAHMTDINPLCFQMAFVQAELLGIPAVIERGDTLTLETFEVAHTTKAMLEVYRRGMLQRRLGRPRIGETRETAATPRDETNAAAVVPPRVRSQNSAPSARSCPGRQGDLFDDE